MADKTDKTEFEANFILDCTFSDDDDLPNWEVEEVDSNGILIMVNTNKKRRHGQDNDENTLEADDNKNIEGENEENEENDNNVDEMNDIEFNVERESEEMRKYIKGGRNQSTQGKTDAYFMRFSDFVKQK